MRLLAAVGREGGKWMRLMLLVVGLALRVAAQDEMLQLSGWRVQEGDDARWARPDFDDSQWPVIRSPHAPSDQMAYRTQPGTWYRKTVEVPDWWKGRDLAIGLGSIFDAYEVYVNGERVGSHGMLPEPGSGLGDRAVTAYTIIGRAFVIPARLWSGGRVQIAIRQWRFRVALGLETHRLNIIRMDLPVLGPSIVVRQATELVAHRSNFGGWPNYLMWTVTFLCGVLCLVLRTDEGDRELLWLGLALVAAGGGYMMAIPMSLWMWPPKNAGWVFVMGFGLRLAETLFYGWFLAELVPAWKRPLRWASIPIALGAASTIANMHFAFVRPGVLLVVVLASFGVQSALALATLWPAWKSGKRGLVAPIAGVALRATVYLVTRINNRINYFSFGDLVVSFRVASDALIAVALVALVYSRLRRERARQQEIGQDLAAARRVQEMLLGSEHTATPGFAVETAYFPAKEVGGDFFQTIAGEDGSLLVVVGDVSGKGLQAAMLVSSVIGSLRNELSRSPGEVLAHLNRSLIGRTGGGFVSCCCLRLDADGRGVVANAGHPAPYLEGREVQHGSGLPLGVVRDTEYPETLLDAGLGTFTLVSDGVVEAANANGELFGFERTQEASSRTAAEIAAAAREWGQNDDITVVTVRRLG